jgi:hypothetical protein
MDDVEHDGQLPLAAPLVEYGSLLVLVAVEEHHDIACALGVTVIELVRTFRRLR